MLIHYPSFLEEIGSNFNDIPYHSNVRWLSKGAVLKRFVELKMEIKRFLTEKGYDTSLFDDKNWMSDFAFLTDIVGYLNLLNQRLQGKYMYIFDMYQELESFQMKLKLFQSNFQNENLWIT